MSGPLWSEAENKHFESLLGDLPWAYVPRVYNSWAAKNGYPARTTTALLRRIDHMGWRRAAVGEWITTGLIVSSLGVSHEAPYWWIRRGWLPAQQLGKRWYVRRKDLVSLAKRRPSVFAGLPREGLMILLENEKLADALSEEVRHPGRRCAIQCVETGRVYGSIAEACRQAAYVTKQRLRRVLDTHLTANGYHWRRI